MFVATFYSYKGGVGRTSALVNVAVRLAHRGKRVFILDFDLEAPGVDAYGLCDGEEPRVGLVEYISAFMRSGEVPPLRDFVLEAALPTAVGKLFVMPAGKKDEEYQAALSRLNWKVLYREKKGYFLVENLKSAIHQQFRPDYLLVDSRTGLTDISGICTLQLPDLVVLLFSLNQQNIAGITPILRTIRVNRINRNIATLLVASPVPDMPQWVQARTERFEYARKTMGSAADVVLPYDPFLAFKESIVNGSETNQASTYLGKAYDGLVEKLISANSADVVTLLKGAIELRDQGNHELAELRYREVVEARPESVEAWLEFGKFEKLQRKFSDACGLFEKAHSLAPDDCEILAQLATTYVYFDKEKCTEYFGKLLELDRNPERVMRVSTTLKDLGLVEPAVEGILLATTLNPKSKSSWIDLGQTYMRLKHYREAKEAYKRGLELAPNDLVCVYNLGAALSRLGDPRATEYFAKAMDLWERTDHSKTQKIGLANQYEAMSHAYLALGKTQAAIKLLEAALALSREFEKGSIFSSVSYESIPQEKFVSEVMRLLERARGREGQGPSLNTN
jgi:cytochrome c-type biogenesis protein CcmH/NrfG/MinD-like ATPase involved in chromosome partitioning or flagellar assembly